MMIWIIFAVMVLVPLGVHLRGGSVVALSVSAAVLYAIGLGIAYLAQQGSQFIATALSRSSPAPETQLCDGGACGDTYLMSTNLEAVGGIALVFALIAFVFWALDRWNAPLPHDRLRSLFWLLHCAILAVPFAMLVFVASGLLASYQNSAEGLPAFGITSMVVGLLTLVALAGFVLAALGAIFKRLRM